MSSRSPMPWASSCSALRCANPGPTGGGLRADRAELGPTGFSAASSHSRPPRICTAASWIASAAGFALAMDVSCHSFLRMAHLAEPLMTKGGCLLTVTFYGSERVVANYNLMGPVKAALESAMRYTPPNSDQKAFAPTRSPRALSAPAPPAESTTSTKCWLRTPPVRRAPAGRHRGRRRSGCVPGQRRRAPHHRDHHPCRWRSARDRMRSRLPATRPSIHRCHVACKITVRVKCGLLQ